MEEPSLPASDTHVVTPQTIAINSQVNKCHGIGNRMEISSGIEECVTVLQSSSMSSLPSDNAGVGISTGVTGIVGQLARNIRIQTRRG